MVHIQGDTYQVTATFTVPAPVARTFRILTDYRQIRRLNADIISSRVVSGPGGGPTLVRLRIRSCVLFVCFHVRQAEDMTAIPDRSIRGVIVPRLSSFRAGYARWWLRPQGRHHTRLVFVTTLVPRFYIPPLIGPWLLRLKLREEIRATVQRLTTLAAAAHPPAPRSMR